MKNLRKFFASLRLRYYFLQLRHPWLPFEPALWNALRVAQGFCHVEQWNRRYARQLEMSDTPGWLARQDRGDNYTPN